MKLSEITEECQELEETIASVLERADDLMSRHDEIVGAYIQNAGEQEQEFGSKPAHYDNMVALFERIEEELTDATNDIRHAYDIFTDRLGPLLQKAQAYHHGNQGIGIKLYGLD